MAKSTTPESAERQAFGARLYRPNQPQPIGKDKPNKPRGERNSSRIVVKGNHVERWLNGMKVLEYECGSPEIMNQVPKTTF